MAPSRAATLSAGVSAMVFDAGGDEVVNGLMLRGGAGVHPLLDITAAVEHWPAYGPYSAWAFELEGSFYALGRPLFAPYLLLGLGYFHTDRNDPVVRRERRGVSHEFALGLNASARLGLGVRVEGVLRVNAGSNDTQVRALATFSPRVRASPAAPEGWLALYWMVPVDGPWRFREPGYAVKFATPITRRHALGLNTVLVHWRMPRPGSTDPGAYSWDTRAVLLAPGWHPHFAGDVLSLYGHVGPVISFMVEGPDAYNRMGAQAEIGDTLEASPIPLTISAGWLWLSRAPVSTIPGTDQHGVMLSVGVRP